MELHQLHTADITNYTKELQWPRLDTARCFPTATSPVVGGDNTEVPHIPVGDGQLVHYSDGVLQAKSDHWKAYMSETYTKNTVFIPLNKLEYNNVLKDKKIDAKVRLDNGWMHVEVLNTMMDCSSTAAFLQSRGFVDFSTDDDNKSFEVYYMWFNMDPNNVRDHMVDNHVNLHRRGYSFCIQQITTAYMMTDEEYSTINVVKATVNPMRLFSLFTWEQGYAWHTQFVVDWRYIVGRADSDRHHVVLQQLLEVHGFEMVDYYTRHDRQSDVIRLMDYIRRFTIQIQPPTSTTATVPAGHPRFQETIEGTQLANKKAKKEPTSGENTVIG